MNPIFNLLVGITAGVLGARAWKNNVSKDALAAKLETGKGAVRSGLARAEEGMRSAAVTGLSTIEKTSADVRRRLESEMPVMVSAPSTEDSPESVKIAKEPGKKVAKKTAKKAATKTAKETAAKKTGAKTAVKKAAGKKTATKKTAVKKSATKTATKTAKKAATKKTVAKTAKKTGQELSEKAVKKAAEGAEE